MAEFDANQKRNIVIIGGGVIGSTTGYFLTRHPKYNPKLHTITLLEATSIASGASGKAGGLLGLWAYPAEIVPLSYRLHRELAEEHGGAEKWGYRRVGCGSIEAIVTEDDLKAAEEARKRSKFGVEPGPEPGVVNGGSNDTGPEPKMDIDTQPAGEPTKENGEAAFESKTNAPSRPTNHVDVESIKEDVPLTTPEHAAKPTAESSAVPAADPAANGNAAGEAAPFPIQSSAEPITVQEATPSSHIITTPDATAPSEAGATTLSEAATLTESSTPSEPTPALSTEATATPSINPTEIDPKDWEKLPKQDTTATSLLTSSPLPADLTWIAPHLITSYQEMGRPGFTETAQVHPYHFTTTLASLARDRGVDIRLGARVTRIDHTPGPSGSVRSVEYLERSTNTTKIISDVTDVVVTAGPWTSTLLPKSKVEGLRAHSVVWEADVAPYAVFTDIKLPGGWAPEHRKVLGQGRRHRGNVDPEIYARPFGEVYACGEPDYAVPLPLTADLVRADEAQCDDLVAYTATVSPILAAAPVKTKQACYLPRHMRFGEERPPLIGRTATPGLWIAAGHTCWGIQNGPGTGCLMAELLLDGKATSANIDKLDPRRYKI